MKRTLALILVLVLALSLFACGKTAAPEDPKTPEAGVPSGDAPGEAQTPVKDTLVVAIEQEGNDFDPQNSGMAFSSSSIIRNVYDPLIRNNPDGTVYGVLATEWEWINDGMALRFKLRENVYFTNGELFTADDVLYSYQVRFPTSSMGKSETIFDFENMEKVSDYEVIIPLKKQASDALNQLTHMKYSIMNQKAVEAAGDKAGITPVGTGAYVLKEWVQGDRTVLAVNDKYWGEAPRLKEITIRVIKESSQAQIELENGNVDAVIFSVGNNDVLRVMNGEIPGLKTISIWNGVNCLQFNFKKEFANNKLVRQALNHCVDREALSKADSNGLNPPAYQPGIPTHACYIEEYNTEIPYEYNPEKAKELLKEAGYENLTLELYTDVSAACITDAQLLKNMFAQAGVTLNIHSLEAGTVVPLVIAGDEDDVFLGFGISDWTGSILQRFRSASDPGYSPDFDNHRFSDVFEPVYEKFLVAEKTLDRDEAVEIMRECSRYEVENALQIPLTTTSMYINCNEGLQLQWNFGDPNFLNWYFE